MALAAGILAVSTPTVKKLGNAIVEYRDPAMHSVAAYEYSHRFHNDAWLMIDVGLLTKESLTFQRADFTLQTPDEKQVQAATEERFVDDSTAIAHIRQNARIWARPLNDYFIGEPAAGFRLYALPGEGVVSDSIVTTMYGPSLVTVYFESLDKHWISGTYHLKIDNGRGRAALPIELK